MSNIIISCIIICILLAVFGVRAITLKKIHMCRKGYVLIPCSAATKNLEQIVKGYYWEEILESSSFVRDIILVQLEESENYYISKQLEHDYAIVHCVNVNQLGEYLKNRELKYY